MWAISFPVSLFILEAIHSNYLQPNSSIFTWTLFHWNTYHLHFFSSMYIISWFFLKHSLLHMMYLLFVLLKEWVFCNIGSTVCCLIVKQMVWKGKGRSPWSSKRVIHTSFQDLMRKAQKDRLQPWRRYSHNSEAYACFWQIIWGISRTYRKRRWNCNPVKITYKFLVCR